MTESDRALLDTSAVVRYLTADPPDLAARAAGLIESESRLVVSEVVLSETAYVLTKLYKMPRERVVDALVGLLGLSNLDLLHLPKPLALAALELCRGSNRTSFSDALLWAQARHLGDVAVCTFDRRFPAEGITVRKLG
jgi:predicted nucleic acid-binding protein